MARRAGGHVRGPGTTVTNVITPGTDFTTGEGQVATPATATLTCLGEPPVNPPDPGSATAVPTLSQWGLMVLSLVLGAAAWTQRRTPQTRRK
ncbi:IPTL-CTERM sorting domain-containing protein [Diaphorobacter aerolatus]|uniref:IPTL-CTERM sorting domain-containing protein n=1 Tax=Diaphorobacter aerolatus TaxID=1288495 RepID=A0A7H0GKP4_9BURK|nr:IPTL-CTERM sorting domain-containing protein [Diaphorobacter aerolatus]QNP48860.1 IPTL-CTERM sorting domain-containing protein [Diaphorobacter aerolatus]